MISCRQRIFKRLLRAMVRNIKQCLAVDNSLRPSNFGVTFRQMMPPQARAAEDELWQTGSSRADRSISLWRPRLWSRSGAAAQEGDCGVR
jgi:hypothetical protein